MSAVPRDLLGLLILTALFVGFINLVPTGAGPFPGTVVFLTLWAATLAGTAAHLAGSGGRVPFPPWAAAGTILTVIFFALFPWSGESLGAKVTSWVNLVGFGTIAYYAYLAINDRRHVDQLVTLVMRTSLLLAAFGVLQSQGQGVLPTALLESRDTEIFGYYGTDIGRSNGLVGNTIVFGALLTLFFALHIARFAVRPNLLHFATTAVVFAGILSTYSRAAIAATGAIFAVVALTVAFRRSPAKFITFSSIAAASVSVLVWAFWPLIGRIAGQSFIISGLFSGGNASVQESNDGHARYIDLGLQIFADHPFIGVGIATQSQESVFSSSSEVITDGAVWARLAEGGLLLTIPYALMLLLVGVVAWRAVRRDPSDWLAAGLLAFMVFQFLGAALINSAFFGKSPFILFWVLFGVLAAKIRLDRESASLPDAGAVSVE